MSWCSRAARPLSRGDFHPHQLKAISRKQECLHSQGTCCRCPCWLLPPDCCIRAWAEHCAWLQPPNTSFGNPDVPLTRISLAMQWASEGASRSARLLEQVLALPSQTEGLLHTTRKEWHACASGRYHKTSWTCSSSCSTSCVFFCGTTKKVAAGPPKPFSAGVALRGPLED